MLKNQNIICISSIDWDFIWQGHQEIMSTFAKNGNRILFIENTGVRAPSFKDYPRLKKRINNWFSGTKGFRQEEKNIFIYSPVILPFPYSRIARWINKRLLIKPLKIWMRTIEFYEPIIWTFLPTGTALDLINGLDKKLLVYYCIADFNELVDNPKSAEMTEEEVIKKCDIIFVQGRVLGEKCKKLNDNVHIFPFGVSTKSFEDFKNQPSKNIPDDMKNIEKPIIGYIGGVHKHIDFSLIRHIAKSHPEWSIVLVGPIQTDISAIEGLPNIFLLGKKDFFKIPSYIHAFDVCIIPYIQSEYTNTVYPTKLNEYHLLGKPVVSTPMPEVVLFNEENGNLVFISKSKENFVSLIEQSMKLPDNEMTVARIVSAGRNNWNERINKMSNIMENVLIQKDNSPILNWQGKLLLAYNMTRMKLIKIAAAFLLFWLLIFYTPIVWFFAGPLKISQKPEKSDCIVVFAGGVGESGKPGQGYEERVKYAVELYKAKYANHIVFSSGYMYVFEEPLVMKALAVSLGVPDEAIILEDKARNTYENIKFTKEILTKEKWKEILLISSPYHMKRVSLVAKKVMSAIKIIYTPIPESRFYNRSIGVRGSLSLKQINWDQIKGLIHEYSGILYYYWKGYI